MCIDTTIVYEYQVGCPLLQQLHIQAGSLLLFTFVIWFMGDIKLANSGPLAPFLENAGNRRG